MEQPRRTEVDRAGNEVADTLRQRPLPSAHAGIHRREESARAWDVELDGRGTSHPNANGNTAQGLVCESQSGGHGRQAGLHDRARSGELFPAWPAEPDVGRVANGVAKRVDRLKALGNGQVPRVAAAAWLRLSANA